jgi:predicted Zn finger-like uncharacterized protein
MIVTCPACAKRYKINEEKLHRKGAKITCLNCSHKFVVVRPESGSVTAGPTTETPVRLGSRPLDIRSRDFREVGITWKVRKGIGLTYDFHDLRSLLANLEEEQIDPSDHLSYDARNWVPIDSIRDLEAMFREVWQAAQEGRINPTAPEEDPEASDNEDDSDAPTTIVRHGTSLRDDIRKAVLDASAPPADPRTRDPRNAYRTEDHAAILDDDEPSTAVDDVPVRPSPPARPAPPAEPLPSGSSARLASAQAKRAEASPVEAPRAPEPAPAPLRPTPPASDGGSTMMMVGVGLVAVILVVLLLAALGVVPLPFAAS